MTNFTATTKSGKTIDVANHTTKCIAMKNSRIWAVSLNRKEAKSEIGFDMPIGQKEALVVINDQTGYAAYKEEQERQAYFAEEAARLATLEGQRQDLVNAEYNLYSPENFPGSKGWYRWNDAVKALETFDAEHPEVKANLNTEYDNFIPSEGGVDL